MIDERHAGGQRTPLTVSAGTGTPDVVDREAPAAPTAKLAVSALVNRTPALSPSAPTVTPHCAMVGEHAREQSLPSDAAEHAHMSGPPGPPP